MRQTPEYVRMNIDIHLGRDKLIRIIVSVQF